MKISEPQIVRVPGATRYVPVDQSLTAPTPKPLPPVALCVDKHGHHVLCDFQLALWIRNLEAAHGSCNDDKAAIAALPTTGK